MLKLEVVSQHFENFVSCLQLDPDPVGSPYYSHEYDGRLTAVEALKQILVDNSVDERSLQNLRLAIREIFSPGDIVFDLGSGPNGHHSTWLNMTGLVTAYAFDGIEGIDVLSGGKVGFADIRNPNDLTRLIAKNQTVDWIWMHDVLDSVRPETALQIGDTIGTNISVRKGIVITWRDSQDVLNPRTDENFSVFLANSRLSPANVLSREVQDLFVLTRGGD
jgi:hypothetical protein